MYNSIDILTLIHSKARKAHSFEKKQKKEITNYRLFQSHKVSENVTTNDIEIYIIMHKINALNRDMQNVKPEMYNYRSRIVKRKHAFTRVCFFLIVCKYM